MAWVNSSNGRALAAAELIFSRPILGIFPTGCAPATRGTARRPRLTARRKLRRSIIGDLIIAAVERIPRRPSVDWSAPRCLSRYADAMDARQVRRWVANFEAAAEADRQALRDRGIARERSIGLSLSMIAAVRRALGGRVIADPTREAEAEHVREVWQR